MHSCDAEFVLWVFLFHFMPKNLHFACVHKVYRVRQRILTAFCLRTRPPVQFGDYELTGTKKYEGFPETSGCVLLYPR